ncbi:HAD family hydrolase [Candidatus Desulforudis audaxviator]|uniref:Haloacid dehalogenase domain protein hydrolase n=1 Tax=Desulforudis audaxviator (strain MP104C) TaxID=477974 RepID=B1I0U0_DESAP|nr:HAD family hydrolase [Candidatus Desulforudis audaxviator]ACA58736.1 Haloacid dehalogenase domain protein hydrolase [Candidatus Desulforudis audaxviator MP104C]AZK58745.1 hypothetical protein Daudx_0187 [Candidatus Desulforudis audaxviator]
MPCKYLLLDLDGTLLPMDKEKFLRGYVQAVAAKMAPHLAPERFVKHLLAATRAMIENLDPKLTNAEVFRTDFFARSGLPEKETMAIFERFYREDFPKLASLTSTTPLARAVCTQALERGIELVVATNPIFPRMAIEERLRWAGVGDLPFRLVTVYENMHFCKPRPQYYQEILDLLGAGPADCLMAGNDPEEDLVAGDLGIRTFLVTDCLITRDGCDRRPDFSGRLSDLLTFITHRGKTASGQQ